MSFKYCLTLLLISFFLNACSSINYQSKRDTLEGYADKSLGNDVFEVTFQTHHKGSHLSQIKNLALRRAVEISTLHKKPFFIVLAEKSEIKDELVTIPEQKILSFSGTGSGSTMHSGGVYQEVETIIPAHIKEFSIQKVVLKVKLLTEYEDGAFSSSENFN